MYIRGSLFLDVVRISRSGGGHARPTQKLTFEHVPAQPAKQRGPDHQQQMENGVYDLTTTLGSNFRLSIGLGM